MSDPRRLSFVDVGGAGGLHPQWRERADLISPVLFEPNPAEAAKIRADIAGIPGGVVIEKALAHVSGPYKLNIANFWGCTSLLEPNHSFLEDYWIKGGFEVRDVVDVECVRYDELLAAGQVPLPDAIKVDVQGFEYQVLLGFGAALDHCLAIELETHLYPIYRNQRLMHDIVELLATFGFVLRRVEPTPNFGDVVVEMNVWFTADKKRTARLSADRRAKLETVQGVWGLPSL